MVIFRVVSLMLCFLIINQVMYTAKHKDRVILYCMLPLGNIKRVFVWKHLMLVWSHSHRRNILTACSHYCYNSTYWHTGDQPPWTSKSLFPSHQGYAPPRLLDTEPQPPRGCTLRLHHLRLSVATDASLAGRLLAKA